jgi:hypothetical protein
MVPRERDGREPKLGVLPIAPHMDVHGLVAIETVEEEPYGPGMPGILGTSVRS